MSEQPQCKVYSSDVAIHWFPTYEDGVPCGCGATTCTVEEDEADTDALGYQIEARRAASSEPEAP